MNPALVAVIAKYGPKAIRFVLSLPKLRADFAASLAKDGQDIEPEMVAALSGNAEAIKVLGDEIDEAQANNADLIAWLEQEKRRRAAQS